MEPSFFRSIIILLFRSPHSYPYVCMHAAEVFQRTLQNQDSYSDREPPLWMLLCTAGQL